MGQGTNRVDECRRQVEATRRRIEGKAEALRHQLRPGTLLRPVTGTWERLACAFQDDPVPLTLVGTGLGWMILRDIRGTRPAAPPAPEGAGVAEKAKEAGQAVGEAAAGAADKVGQAAAKVKQSVRRGRARASDWFTTTLDENPTLLAVGTLVLGILAGLGAPVTKREEETLGKVGEQLAAGAMEKGAEALQPAEGQGRAPEPDLPPPA